MSNISSRILDAQKAVFEALDIELAQVNIDGMNHGHWMTDVAHHNEKDLIVFCDIDAFPITRKAYESAIISAKNGKLFGLAQTANHIRPSDIYAGPMFMAFSKEMYERIESPTLAHDDHHDPAQSMTDRALAYGIDVDICYPTSVILPQWPLANKGVFGIGTFYGDLEFFHLFQSRFPKNIDLFVAVAEDVSRGRPLNFSAYLSLVPPTGVSKKLLPKLFLRADS
jgi:hypothetical protein